MRSILNISVPEELAREIKREVKRGKYASTSEYIRAVFRELAELKLYYELESQRKAFDAGKGKILRSLRDLR